MHRANVIVDGRAWWHADCCYVTGWLGTPLTNQSRDVMLKKLLFCFAALSTVTLIGCNTVQGAGKDIERGGQKVQEEAKEVKQKM